jgi:CPA2 family monovalent cation:H+ antiporter-2
MAIVFATAYLTSLAGLSVSLGAFLAGLLVSESRFGQHALGEILPLQIIFSGVFFVSVGMLLDLGFVVDHIGLVVAAIAIVLAIKLVVTAASARAFGIALPIAGATALMLAQVGEFSFVLERVGASEGLMPAGLEGGGQLLIATTVLLMAATPPLMSLGRRLTDEAERVAPAFDPERGFRGSSAASEVKMRDHVILAGYGDGARRIVPALREAEMPFVITTLNPSGAREAQAEGLPVLQGDHTKAHLLQRAGIHDARLLVVADDELETTYRVASVARALNPQLDILARTQNTADIDVLADAGASRVISGDRASADALPAAVLRECRLDGPGPSIDTERVLRFEPTGPACEHMAQANAIRPRAAGCEACMRMGDEWVHLRACLECGHVGCCDSSPNRHASAHSNTTGHPVMVSLEPNEDWAWCYVDQQRFRGRRSTSAHQDAKPDEG